MKWTFGILAGDNPVFVHSLIDSIRNQSVKIPEYQILVIGDAARINQFAAHDVDLIEFDESERQGWITKKKNLIALHAKYENISMHHDYATLCSEWYKNFLKFGEDWDVAMTRIENYDGTRFRDWVTWMEELGEKTIQFLSYSETSRTHEMYVSGTYFCVKKEFMLAHPFDENLLWGQGEDVEWSKSVRNSWKYKMNFLSTVKFLKRKSPWPQGPDPFHDEYVNLIKQGTVS